ncbi:MAG: hybrid sensor histidine kinase/response regulator [Haloarculaceae archaeon]
MGAEETALAVLLVEDNPGDAKLVEHHLQKGSFPGVPDKQAITHVESLEAAFAAVESSTFDVVLLDLGLPECTGGETLASFLPEVPEVPVIVLTGLNNKETAVEAIQQGAQDYLPKDDLGSGLLLRAIRYAIERKKQELALREQTEQMKFFNSVLRHDVGNGMEVIRRNAQLLEQDVDGEAADRAETILSWSDDVIELTGKVRHMLDAVVEGSELALSPTNLSATLRDRLDHVASMDDSVAVDAEIPDDVRIVADDMLPAVLGNVLSNAIEHNDSAEPHLTVRVREGADTVTVDVADNGPGVPDAAKEQIFGWGESRSESGSGFGLYFVETMVETYGGRVDVTDNDPSGAVFTLTFQSPTAGSAFGEP